VQEFSIGAPRGFSHLRLKVTSPSVELLDGLLEICCRLYPKRNATGSPGG